MNENSMIDTGKKLPWQSNVMSSTKNDWSRYVTLSPSLRRRATWRLFRFRLCFEIRKWTIHKAYEDKPSRCITEHEIARLRAWSWSATTATGANGSPSKAKIPILLGDRSALIDSHAFHRRLNRSHSCRRESYEQALRTKAISWVLERRQQGKGLKVSSHRW